MARNSYPPSVLIQQSFTPPPKAQDIKFYSGYMDPIDDFIWDPEFINFSFTFFEEDKVLSEAYEFLIEIQNVDTGVIKSFVQLADKSYYEFWQRQAEVYTESPIGDEIDLTEEAIVNSRIIVTPINDFGDGAKSVFFLPFKDVVWTRAKDNHAQETFAVLNTNWSLFSKDPFNRRNRPKIMYIYLDVSEGLIERDREILSEPEWQYDSLTDSKTINDQTYRWSVKEDEYRLLTEDGWRDSTADEQTFIIDLVQTMLPAYRNYMSSRGLVVDKPHMFKMGVENPQDNKDSILIYLLKGITWRP